MFCGFGEICVRRLYLPKDAFYGFGEIRYLILNLPKAILLVRKRGVNELFRWETRRTDSFEAVKEA